MNEYRKRLSKSFGVAIVVHLLAALLLGLLGFSFHSSRPPEILEVTLTAGGGSPQEQQEEIVEEKVVVQEPDPIVDKKQKPKEEKKVVQKQPAKNTKPSPNPNPNPLPGNDQGKGEGTGTGDAPGSGSGKGVPVTPPRILSARDPIYPSAARSKSIEGTVFVKMLVDKTGKVVEASIAKSSGHEDLDSSALQAVYKWKFSPARDKLKEKVACYITIPVNFKLRR